MSNMSHCRFQNTNRDLSDCDDALQSLIEGEDGGGEPPQPLSAEEKRHALALVETASNFLQRVADETGISEDDLLAFDRNTREEVSDFLDRLNREADTRLRDEGAEEEDGDED